MASYLGDFAEDAMVRGTFNTRAKATGAPIIIAGSPTLAVYKDGSVTEITAGVAAISIDFDSRVGHHLYAVDTSASADYSTGSDYRIVLTAGTVDGESVVGVEVAAFSIQNRYSPSGSGLDAAGVRAAVGLAAANLDTQLADLPTVAEFEARTILAANYFVVGDYTAPPTAAFISQTIAGEVSLLVDDWLDAVQVIQTGLASQASVDTIDGIVDAILIDTGTTLDALIKDIPTVAEFELRSLPSADYFVVSDYTAPPTAAANADAVWDEAIAGHLTAGSTGASLNAAGGSGDPWTTTLPGAYTGSQAGKILADVLADTAAMPTASQNAVATSQQISADIDDMQNGWDGGVAGIGLAVWSHVVVGPSTTAAQFLIAVGGSLTTLLDRILGVIRTSTDDVSAETAQTAAIRSGLATEAKQDAMAGATFDTATDSLEAIRNRGDAAWTGGGGGGDATAANQAAILAAVQGAQVIQVPSPNVGGNLVLTQGDTYDGIGNAKAQWNVTTDYTDGWAVVLTIRDKDDAVVYTTTGTVDSATVVSVAITTPTVTPMAGCPGSWQGKFDVQLSKAGSVKTIALGTCFINEDQTR